MSNTATGARTGPTDATSATASMQGTQELTSFVQNLLQHMQDRFQEMSDSIITRIDEMGNRIDDLEKSISELMQQAGMEEETKAPAAQAKPRGKKP
ncbi:Heat shock factor binding 1 [Trypanosoma melophagium]|uniref:Heat shock factor binding 1 n=1 Tax=Trypanosoma melophagium TaxID=715481 RepID=UPI00351A4F34|nr:Heat shock factor binding 1 [Trypanosoma melophagium]